MSISMTSACRFMECLLFVNDLKLTSLRSKVAGLRLFLVEEEVRFNWNGLEYGSYMAAICLEVDSSSRVLVSLKMTIQERLVVSSR